MKMIRAIYENGIFRPTEPPELPDQAVVEFEPKLVTEPSNPDRPAKRAIYEILSRSYEGDDPEVSARHDEHQP